MDLGQILIWLAILVFVIPAVIVVVGMVLFLGVFKKMMK